MTTDNKINPQYNSSSSASSISSSTISIVSERSSLLSYKKNTFDTTYKIELKWLTINSLPIILTYVLQNSFQLTSIYFLGHLGSIELGASALGFMFANVSAFSISLGAATALDSLMTQAWSGATDKTLLGVHLQRSILILSLLLIPISIVWLNVTSLLLFLKQDQQIAEYTGLYLRYLLFGVPPYIYFEVFKKFLQAQGIMQASTYCLLIVAPINIVLNYLFIHQFHMGFIGAPLATSCSYWLMFLLLLIYIFVLGNGKAAFGQWQRECLKEWSPFLRLAFFGVLTVVTEWVAFEIVSLAASYLGSVDLAAQSILITLSSLTYTIPYGLSVAVANRVGNALGEANGQKASCATKVSLGFAVLLSVINSAVILVFQDKVAYLFTTEKEVIQLVAAVLPLCALFQLTDSLANTCAGVIRSLGRQHISAKINLIAYYFVALPLGYYLTFTREWGLYGLWSALAVALFLCALGQAINLYLVDWDYEAHKAHHRVKKEEEVLLYLPN
ncbi:unnamed protein product [Cunninghamella echinulata]